MGQDAETCLMEDTEAEAVGMALFAPEYPRSKLQHAHPQIPLYGVFMLVKLR